MNKIYNNNENMRKSAVIIASAALLSAALMIGALLLFVPREYSSELSLLVVQKYTLTDTYTAQKSAEKISQNLAAVVHTSSFFEEVVRTAWVDLNDITQMESEEDKREEWKKKIETSVDPGTSIITVTGYDVNPDNAERLVQAASTALLEHGANYHGAPDTVSLRVVDSALTSDRPTRPNLLINSLLAAVAGGAVAAVLVFFHPAIVFSVDPLKQTGGSQTAKKAENAEKIEKAPVTQAPAQAPVTVTVDNIPQPASKAEYAVLDVENFNTHVPKHNTFTAEMVTERVQSLPQQHLPKLTVMDMPA